jgi:para-aminobenzoate synthetase component 1
MITDLVRMSDRTKGSVQVTELCGIYSFMQVHQMISTVTSKLDWQYSAVEAIKVLSYGKYDRCTKFRL